MKNTAGNKGWMADREETTARKDGAKKAARGRQASFHVELLHDTVWEGY